jgi:hypothetical protein
MVNRIVLASIFLFMLPTGCKKNSSTSNSGVPNVVVNINIDILTDIRYNALTITGGWMYVSGGYLNHGIIIYRASTDQFYAMDRTCTYNNNGVVQMTNSSGFFAIDSTCKSQFTIPSGGTVKNGPASLPLKNYTTNFDGEYLTITN